MRSAMISMVVVLLWTSNASAQMLADGSYQMTGNAAIDVGLSVVNALNKEIAVKHEFQKFYVNSGKLEKAMAQRLDEMTQAKATIIAERRTHLDAGESLRRQLQAAGGDKKELDRLEKQRKALDDATAKLEKADKALDKAIEFGKVFHKSVNDIRTARDEKQALEYWNKGVRTNLVKAKKKLEENLKTFATSLQGAGKDIAKGGAGSKVAIHEAFTAEVTELANGKTIELYVNGKKMKVGGTIGVGKDNKLELRAMIVPPRREQARNFRDGKKSTAQVTVTAADEYTLSYSLGARRSDWKVQKETYEWKEPETRTGAKLMLARRASGSVAKEDVLDVTFPSATGSETIRGWVHASIEWAGPSQEDASEGLSYEIKIYPTR